MAADVPVVIIVVPPLSFGRLSARGGWGKARAGEILGGRKIFQPAFPFPVPHSPLPQKLGTDPTIVNKIKGLRGFGGRARARGGRETFYEGYPHFLRVFWHC